MTPYVTELATSVAAVRTAAAVCGAVRAGVVSAVAKGDLSPVTVADFASQAVICQVLAEAFPLDPVVAEEESDLLRMPEHADLLAKVYDTVRTWVGACSSQDVCRWVDHGGGTPNGRYWTVDPLDGTQGFVRGGQYAVAIALVEDGQPVVAALACPSLSCNLSESPEERGVYFAAVRGGGAWTSPLDREDRQPVRAQGAADGDTWRLTESWEAKHGNPALQAAVASAVGITLPAVRMDSQAKYGLVARGEAALYLRFPSRQSPDYREKVWDHAAGVLLVEEAGGKVTDMDGQPLDWTCGRQLSRNHGLLVGSREAHARALDAVVRLASTAQSGSARVSP